MKKNENFKMEKSERRREEDSTLITMARTPLKSNFSINAILPEIANRTPPEGSPAPSSASEPDESDDADVIVDYESENEGNYPSHTVFYLICFFFFSFRKSVENSAKKNKIVETFQLIVWQVIFASVF